MKPLPLPRRNLIVPGFLLAFAILGLAAVAVYRQGSSTLEAERWVRHTYEVLAELAAALGSAAELQSNTRGYVITGEQTYLAALEKAEGSIDRQIATLRALTADNPEQQARLERLASLVDRRIDTSRRQSALRRTLGLAAAEGSLKAGEGAALGAEIARLIEEASAAERGHLERRTDALYRSSRGNLAASLLLIGLLAVALSAALVVTRRYLVTSEHALKLGAERDRLLELSRDPICVTGFDGYFKRLNPAWERTLGFTIEELKAAPFLSFVHEDDRAATEGEARRLAAGEPTVLFENRYRCKDGSYRWFLWSAAPWVQQNLIFAVAHDITERRRSEEALGRLNRDLKRRNAELLSLNQELEAFTYSVSHDLRAPLRHMDGFARILVEDFGERLEPPARRHLGRIQEAAQRMGRLVDGLLNLSRTGRKELLLQPTRLGTLLEQARSELREESEGRAVEWRIGPLPAVECDPTLMQQVLTNLLSNALKYTQPRERAVIEVGQLAQNGNAVVYVRDNGVGFDMRHADKLFGIFQRLHRQEDFAGTGIGLATVQRIVLRHGGRVWAESQPDKGATFYFSVVAAGGEKGGGHA